MAHITRREGREGFNLFIDSLIQQAIESDAVGSHLYNARALQLIASGEFKWNDRDLFTGPRNIRDAYASEDLIRWQSEKPHRHLTYREFCEWIAADNHSYLVEAKQAYQENPLADLELLRDLEAQKDSLIRAARETGNSWATIMASTGMTRAACYQAYKRAGGQPTNVKAVEAA